VCVEVCLGKRDYDKSTDTDISGWRRICVYVTIIESVFTSTQGFSGTIRRATLNCSPVQWIFLAYHRVVILGQRTVRHRDSNRFVLHQTSRNL